MESYYMTYGNSFWYQIKSTQYYTKLMTNNFTKKIKFLPTRNLVLCL